MKAYKKFISLLLSAVMLMTFSLPAFAAETLNTVPEGEVLLFSAPESETTEKAKSKKKTETETTEKKKNKKETTEATTEKTTNQLLDSLLNPDSSVKFNAEKAHKVALTAAKSKFTSEGISSNVSDGAIVTKLKYDKKTNSYTATVRAQRVYKYTCKITVKNFLGAELGIPEDSQFVIKGRVSAFFGQGAEKFSYFFIKLFGQDGPKE